MHARCKATFCEESEMGPSLPPPHVCLFCSLNLFLLPLSLSLNVYEPLGTVHKKFIGSLRRVASLMLDVGSFFFSSSSSRMP